MAEQKSNAAVTMIAATGVFFIMTMGGLDFSQGSILGMASIVVCMVSKVAPVPVAVLAGIATGAGIGAINGFFYVNRKIKSFIVTICTMFLFRGIIKYLTSDADINCAGGSKCNDDPSEQGPAEADLHSDRGCNRFRGISFHEVWDSSARDRCR